MADSRSNIFELITDPNLDPNLKNELADNLGAGGIINFAKTSRFAYTLFRDEYKLALAGLISQHDSIN